MVLLASLCCAAVSTTSKSAGCQSYLQRLAHAKDNSETAVKRRLCLSSNELSAGWSISFHTPIKLHLLRPARREIRSPQPPFKQYTHNIIFTHDYSPFAVSRKRPCDSAISQLLGADLASIGAIGLVEDVLSSNFDFFTEVLTGEKEI